MQQPKKPELTPSQRETWERVIHAWLDEYVQSSRTEDGRVLFRLRPYVEYPEEKQKAAGA